MNDDRKTLLFSRVAQCSQTGSSMRKSMCISGVVVASLVGACGSSGPPCPTGVTQCVSIGAGASADSIEADFASLTDGQTVVFGAGTFLMTDTIIIAANNVTVIGAGSGKTIFDFSGEKGGDGEGFFAQSVSNIKLQGFTVKDTLGNAVKVLGSNGVVMNDLETVWTADDPSTHGGYGLYPVQCTNVVIEHCTVTGGSDSGVYLGQSDHAVIHDNVVHDNVGGIEIENTYFAEVFANEVHDNTAGILVFDLPGLQQLHGHDVSVHDNKIHDNNTANFAAPGDIVGIVPRGTGFLAMANSNVEFFHNDVENNETGNTGTLSYYVSQQPIQDPNYYPFPKNVWIHDNTFVGGGNLPDLTRQIGLLLSTAVSTFPGGAVPSLLWDGFVDPAIAQADPNNKNPMGICYTNNGSATFVDLHVDQLDAGNDNLATIMTEDMTDYTCSGTAVAPVTFPGSDQ